MTRKTIPLLFIFLSTCLVSSAKLTAEIRMDNVVGVIEFSKSTAGEVTGSLEERKNFPSGSLSVDIRSFWVNYDLPEKCSDANIGNSVLSVKPNSWDMPSTTLFTLKIDIDSMEGRSILIEANDKRYCASIWSPDAEYQTAIANFAGQIVGSIFFRRPDGESKKTLVFSDLASVETFQEPKWKITESIKNCDDLASFSTSDKFDPGNSGNTAVGDLSQSLGALLIGSIQGSRAKKSYSGSYLSLSHDSQSVIIDKFLIVYDHADHQKAVCAKIQRIQTKKASSLFSHQGIQGHISFTQRSPLDKTLINVDLRGLNARANGYHVHLYPVPVQTEKNQKPCSGDIVAGHFNPHRITDILDPAVNTEDQYEIGDLSSKYGNLRGKAELSASYTDWNLPLFGKNSIVGRSIVIHRDDSSNSRWVCANIEVEGDVTSGVAIFKYPVYGHVYFTQAQGSSYSDTDIFAHLSYLSPSSTLGHKWYINDNKAGKDMMASGAKRCASNKEVYDPLKAQLCPNGNQGNAKKCNFGDMFSRHGALNIGQFPQTKAFFTDVALPLTGKDSILGKSLVIMDQNGANILACATIEPLHKPMLKADLSLGTVTFSQQPGFGQRPTKVSLDLSTFDRAKHRLQIFSLPPSDGDSKCSDLGGVYDPLSASGSASTVSTDDRFKVGDLSRARSDWKDLNLPLTGRTSIRHRALVVLDKQAKVVTCGLIQDPFSKTFEGYQAVAKVTFHYPLKGSIDLFQTLREDGTMTDTSVVVSLSNKNGSKTPEHNWHVHLKPVLGDADASTDRCSSTGPHYDPYKAKIGQADTKYGEQCSKVNPLRCELGDQAMKLGTYSLGSGRKLFTDVDLPLNGMYKVQGRSIVVHVENKGAPRYACADINPVSNLVLSVEFKTPESVDLQKAARLYTNAIGALEEEVVVQLLSPTGDVRKAYVHFLGFSREQYRAKFKSYFSKASNRDDFGDYAPLSDPIPVTPVTFENSKADGKHFSAVLLLLMLTIIAVNY